MPLCNMQIFLSVYQNVFLLNGIKTTLICDDHLRNMGPTLCSEIDRVHITLKNFRLLLMKNDLLHLFSFLYSL